MLYVQGMFKKVKKNCEYMFIKSLSPQANLLLRIPLQTAENIIKFYMRINKTDYVYFAKYTY